MLGFTATKQFDHIGQLSTSTHQGSVGIVVWIENLLPIGSQVELLSDPAEGLRSSQDNILMERLPILLPRSPVWSQTHLISLSKDNVLPARPSPLCQVFYR
jgi:hypothetical protein